MPRPKELTNAGRHDLVAAVRAAGGFAVVGARLKALPSAATMAHVRSQILRVIEVRCPRTRTR